MSRQRLLALTLALLVTIIVDQASGIAHSATHSNFGVEHCDLCLGYSQQAHGVPPSLEIVPQAASHLEPLGFVATRAASRRPPPNRQRGPPAIS